mgnify:CR=1 FL=1
MSTKGIILAGGKGTRLYPLTQSVSKQLLPLYDKPLIFYPLSILMLSKIRDILIICKKEDKPLFKKILSDGKYLGLNITYAIQEKPKGLPEAFIIGEKFINKSKVMLVLGDNFFYGQGLEKTILKALNSKKNTIFAYKVKDPKNYGVVKLNKYGKIIKIVEKPKKFISDLAITGLYFFDRNVVKFAKKLRPSKRNELEITDLLNKYRKKNNLSAEFLGRGGAWLDTGSIDDFYNTSAFVSALENRQGLKIACLEEIALNYNWISKRDVKEAINFYGNCLYSKYLKKLI